MKTPFCCALACLLVSVVPSRGEIVWSEDFESVELGTVTPTNKNVGNVQPANALNGRIVEAPAGFDLATGNVILLSTEVNAFAAIRPGSDLNPIILPPVADGLTWSLSFDVFLPDNVADDVGGILSFRWKDGGTNNQNGPGDDSGAVSGAGQHRIVYSGSFPIEGDNGPFLPTNVRPLIGFAQNEEILDFVYLDNIVFEVGVTGDDPNLLAEAVNFGKLPQDEGTYTRPVTISNTGADKRLTITAAEIGGLDAANFAITDPGLPLEIRPGETGTISVTFDPAQDVSEFLATLVITSNDESNPVIMIDLAGETQEPFEGRELIENGNFETGDLTGWDDLGNITYQEAPPARRGNGSGVYTTVAGEEFGSLRLFTEPPIGAVEDFFGIAITGEMIGAPYQYSAWYYRPSLDGIGGDDEMSTIFRWNGVNLDGDVHGNLLPASMPFDTWIRVVGTGVIPPTSSDGVETAYVVPVFSFRDNGADNPGGQRMFIDEVSFKVGVLTTEAPVISEITLDIGTGVVSISWSGLPGAVYSFERVTSLDGTWEKVSDDLTAGDGTSTFEDAGAAALGAPTLFYRLREASPAE